jgi:hypothetical protein
MGLKIPFRGDDWQRFRQKFSVAPFASAHVAGLHGRYEQIMIVRIDFSASGAVPHGAPTSPAFDLCVRTRAPDNDTGD